MVIITVTKTKIQLQPGEIPITKLKCEVSVAGLVDQYILLQLTITKTKTQ